MELKLSNKWLICYKETFYKKYSWFHIKGTFSVHSFNDDYLSIPERPGSYKYLFHEIPGIYTAGFIKKVLSVYTHSMTTIYLSQSTQVAKSTFFMKSPVFYIVLYLKNVKSFFNWKVYKWYKVYVSFPNSLKKLANFWKFLFIKRWAIGTCWMYKKIFFLVGLFRHVLAILAWTDWRLSPNI